MRPNIIAGLLALVSTFELSAQHAPNRVHVEPLGEGVWGVVRHDPIGAIRRLTSKPVRYVARVKRLMAMGLGGAKSRLLHFSSE